jgi:regulator of Ty1 transposition protein 103
MFRGSHANPNKIIAEATAVAYKGSSNDIQQKIRRVVEVWRQRSIFEPAIQDAVEARVDGKPSSIIFIDVIHS